MNGTLFWRLALFLVMLPMTALFALLPVRKYLRFSRTKTALIFGAALAGLIALLSLLGVKAALPAKWPYALGLFPLLGVYFALVRDAPARMLFCFFNATMIATNGIVFGTLAAAPLELANPDRVPLPVTGLICLASAALLGALYFRTLTVQLPYLLSSDALTVNWKIAALIPLSVSLVFFWVMPRSAAVVMTGRVRATTMAFLLIGPLAYLLVYRAMWGVAVNVTENARLREENELMAMERKRYEELRAYMDDTRMLRHDFRQHMLVLEEYAKAGETEKLMEYIGRSAKAMTDHRGNFAANAAVDAVASHYDAAAREQGTHIQWQIELPEALPIPESDFIAIFGNLTENALHAVKELQEERRIVQVTTRMLSDAMLGLTIKNPYAGEIVLKKDGLPRAERAGHGVGLSSVAAAVNRFHGALDINTDNGVFTAGVLLYTLSEDGI